MRRRCERSNSASSSKLRACWRHVRFRRLVDCYRYPNDSRQETAYRFRPLRFFIYFYFFFFRLFRDPTALRSSIFIPVLSLVKRCVCAREDFLNLFHAFCLHMKMAVFIFLPILRKKRNLITFNNFPRDKMKGGHVIFFISRVEESGFH